MGEKTREKREAGVRGGGEGGGSGESAREQQQRQQEEESGEEQRGGRETAAGGEPRLPGEFRRLLKRPDCCRPLGRSPQRLPATFPLWTVREKSDTPHPPSAAATASSDPGALGLEPPLCFGLNWPPERRARAGGEGGRGGSSEKKRKKRLWVVAGGKADLVGGVCGGGAAAAGTEGSQNDQVILLLLTPFSFLPFLASLCACICETAMCISQLLPLLF